jgi:hypothetical protein
MRYIRWPILFAAVALIWACTPFLGPRMPDGGDGPTFSPPDGREDSVEATLSFDSQAPTDIAGGNDSLVDITSASEVRPDLADATPEAPVDIAMQDADDVRAKDVEGDQATCPGAPGCKKLDGELCVSDSECATGTCGGRCCAAGCSCTQPSAANLLVNPGIDRDLNGWRISQNTLSRSLSDAERCPYSGSLTTVLPAGRDELTVDQCVSHVPLKGDFNFGARSNTVNGSGYVVACQLAVYSGFNCDGDLILTNETDSSKPNFGWQQLDASLSMISGANSFDFSCYLFADSQLDTTFYLDMLYVSRAPSRY